MKRRNISLSVLVALMSGCDYDPTVDAQRDVYTRMEDCVADWGDAKLCQQMAETAAKEAQTQQSVASSGGHPVYYPYFFHGPTYYGGSRVAYDGEREIRPIANHAKSFKSTSVLSSTLPSHVNKAISRSGFGSTGRSVASTGRSSFGG